MSLNSSQIFSELSQTLSVAGIKHMHVPAGQGLSYDVLLIEWTEAELPTLVMQLSFRHDLLASLHPDYQPEAPYTLQWVATLSDVIGSEQQPLVAELLIQAQRLLPLGGFGVGPDQKLYFNYSWLLGASALDTSMIAQLVEQLKPWLRAVNQAVQSVLEQPSCLAEQQELLARVFG